MSEKRELPLDAALGRRLRTEARVEFSDCDPYRHMNSAAYLELAIDHRMHAVKAQLGFDTFGLADETGIAFISRDIQMSFKYPAQMGDALFVDSWIDALSTSRMVVKVQIRLQSTDRVCCELTIESVTMDLRQGRVVPLPATVPCAPVPSYESLPWAEGHPRASS